MKEVVDDPMLGEEMSKLGELEEDINGADKEDNDQSFFSDLEEDGEPYLSDSQDELTNPKEHRDIAEGKNLNNSFTGPYPESWDHLHFDKGSNPQFQYLNEDVENNILELAQKILNKK